MKLYEQTVSSLPGLRCVCYLRSQPPHGLFLAPPHLRGPRTAASSQGAMSGLRLGQREALSIWTRDNNTLRLYCCHMTLPLCSSTLL